MSLWHVATNGIEYFLTDEEDGSVIVRFRNRERAQQICDGHNAWVILAERGWSIRNMDDGTWMVTTALYSDYPSELQEYMENAHDTPQAAILAADKWLTERGK